ncbi:MAG: type 4a pilus biogenesis protein PilO [Gammaproteobacteria bacterium]|nr:type 4a pilus biogenesis protein PilO [Gammaproteobacteria bacterium]
MAIDMNIDIGEILKKLTSKKDTSSSGGGDGKKPNDPFTKVIIAGVITLIVVILYLFFVHFPAQEENRIKEQKIAQINDLKSCITELSEGIATTTKDLSSAKSKYKKLTNLFHSGQELDDLYRHISMLALTNQLMVSKINKSGESPVFEAGQPIDDNSASDFAIPDLSIDETSAMGGSLSACDNIQSMGPEMADDGAMPDMNEFQDSMPMDGMSDEESKPKKVAYYELKVEFEISGNYANYTNFRKGLAKLKKIININQEKIIVLESKTKKGEVKVETTLAIYRLPANDSEKYATDNQSEDLL